MIESRLDTLNVPPLGTSAASILASARVPCRVLVRNLDPLNTIVLSYDAAEMVSAVGSSASHSMYQQPAGAVEVYVLAPGQSLFACGIGVTVKISIHVSEVFRIDSWFEMEAHFNPEKRKHMKARA